MFEVPMLTTPVAQNGEKKKKKIMGALLLFQSLLLAFLSEAYENRNMTMTERQNAVTLLD